VLTSYSVDDNPIPQLRTFVETRVGDELVIDQEAEGVLRAGVMNRRSHPLIAGPQGRTVSRPFER